MDDNFKTNTEQHILSKTGYTVEVVRKEFVLFFDALKQGSSHHASSDVPQAHLRPGNCIPAAIARLTGKMNETTTALNKRTVMNKSAEEKQFRSYADAQTLCACWLLPSRTDRFAVGSLLIHAENGGSPHCIAVKVKEGGDCE
eukprot:9264516-Karenia_brevis.AAC.1